MAIRIAKECVDLKMQIPGAVIRQQMDCGEGLIAQGGLNGPP